MDDETGPVAMFLACYRRKWGGYRYRFVVLDLDTGRGGAAAVQEQAAALADLLRSHGIATVRVASGPGGGVHLWAACPGGLAPAMVRRLGEALALLYPTVDPSPLRNPEMGVVRPPGALHRSGGRAHLTDRTDAEAIATLKAGTPAERFEALLSTVESMAAAPSLWSERRARHAAPPSIRTGGRTVPPSVSVLGPVVRPVGTCAAGRPRIEVAPRPLGPRAQAAARRRPRSTPGAHQAAIHATATACALAGWTHAQFCEFAGDPERSPALEWLRTYGNSDGTRTPLSENEAARRIDRAWWLAVQAAARLPRRPNAPQDGQYGDAAEAAADLLARIEAAGAAHWRRPSGPADRAVLRAVAYLMVTSGNIEVSADVRRVAVLAGYSKSTAALALSRLILDGWLAVAQEADKNAGVARRVRLAQAHHCPPDKHHMCATYTTSDQEEHGSDRRLYAAPPMGSSDLLSKLGAAIAHQQAGLWHELGHHAARTLEAVQDRHGTVLETLRQLTGYTTATVARHVAVAAVMGLVQVEEGPDGAEVTRTTRTLYEAGATIRTASRPAELAAVAAVEVEVARWWRREVEWCRLSREQKRKSGSRAHARQIVLPGADPYARAYPRRPGSHGRPERGEADHAAAFAIEAERINAAALAVEADQLAQRGEVIDPARLGHRRGAEVSLTLAAAA